MNLEERVIKLVCEVTKAETSNVGKDTSLIDDLNLDSLDMAEMMMKMEDEFGIEIPENETENLKTIGDVTTFLSAKQVN